MGKGRTIVLIVAFALLVGLLGSCSSSSKSSAKVQARTAAQAKAARAKIAAAKRRLAAARLRVTRQRRALAAEVRRRQLQARAAAKAAAKRAATTTTTTTGPKVPTPTTVVKPSAPGPPASPTGTLAADVAAIQQTLDAVNAAFAKGVADGIAASEGANYYIAAGVYTNGQCSAFEARRGLGIVADRLVVHPGSIVATPGWVDPILHGVPKGRVYALTMDDIQTQIVTKQSRSQSVSTHATVGPNGHAKLFFRCA
jgi:hypothetical protein